MGQANPRAAVSLHDFIVEKGYFEPVHREYTEDDDVQQRGNEEKVRIFIAKYFRADSSGRAFEFPRTVACVTSDSVHCPVGAGRLHSRQ